MDKEDRYHEILEQKCDEYLQHLIRIGTKLAKKGKLDEETFSKTFLPQKEFVMKKIREQVNEESPRTSDFDSKLIEQLREICNGFEKEFKATNSSTKNNYESPRASSSSMKSAADYESPKMMKKPVSNVHNAHGDAHFLSHELNYGELSKIFVQKSRVDVVRSAMDKPDFEDHLETIYVYRAKPC
jgi:hypothetical protein